MNQSKLPNNVSVANDKMKAIDPSFRVTNTEYKTFMKLIKDMEKKGHIKSETLATGENRIVEICV